MLFYCYSNETNQSVFSLPCKLHSDCVCFLINGEHPTIKGRKELLCSDWKQGGIQKARIPYADPFYYKWCACKTSCQSGGPLWVKGHKVNQFCSQFSTVGTWINPFTSDRPLCTATCPTDWGWTWQDVECSLRPDAQKHYFLTNDKWTHKHDQKIGKRQ